MFITTALVCVWVAFIVLEMLRNYIIIEEMHTRPNYLVSFILRGMISIFHGVLFDCQDILQYGVLLLFQCTSFFVVFGPLLNKARGKEFWYLGEDSGWLDDLFMMIPYAYRFVYFTCLSICVLTLGVIYFYF